MEGQGIAEPRPPSGKPSCPPQQVRSPIKRSSRRSPSLEASPLADQPAPKTHRPGGWPPTSTFSDNTNLAIGGAGVLIDNHPETNR